MSIFDEEKKEATVSTWEQLLMRRLDKAFEAMDTAQGDLFDDIIDEMEMLFKLKPDIYNQLIEYKEKLTANVSVLVDNAEKLANTARNHIRRKAFYDSEIESIEWDARKDYLDAIISIMGINQMIPMETSEPAMLEDVEEEPETEEKQEEPKKEEKQKSKPKLSFNPKKTDKEFVL